MNRSINQWSSTHSITAEFPWGDTLMQVYIYENGRYEIKKGSMGSDSKGNA
jgi:hypothetical protein